MAMARRNVRPGRHGRPTRPLIVQTEPDSPFAEAYRALRTNLQFLAADRPLGAIVVTSAGPEEGKTTVTANLAAAMARAGDQVIIVGADMRKPTVHEVFGCSRDVGLTSVLTGHMDWQDAIQDTAVDGVRLLASGPIPPNPAELLGSERMHQLLIELREEADMVLIDAPPVLNVADAAVLARWVDGYLYVVSIGLTPREAVKEGKRRLDQVGARLLGTIVNRIDDRSASYPYYQYSYREDTANGRMSWWQRWRRARSNGAASGGRRT